MMIVRSRFASIAGMVMRLGRIPGVVMRRAARVAAAALLAGAVSAGALAQTATPVSPSPPEAAAPGAVSQEIVENPYGLSTV